MNPKLATVTVVIPTWNEVENVELVYQKVCKVLDGHGWELLFVDDNSTDGTWREVQNLAKSDQRVRLIRRVGRTGLSSACVEGINATTTPLVAVMDADLQHDETLLLKMLQTLNQEPSVELVVASRNLSEASFGDMSSIRARISQFATWLAQVLLKSELSDPMSGFFMLRRELFDETADQLYGQGFKILLDISVAAGRPIIIREFPYRMRARQSGTSKLGIRVALELLIFLVSRWTGRILPERFFKFCLVGASGVIVHMSVLALVHRLFQYPFLPSLVSATLTAMIFNYWLNNRFTFPDRRLTGVFFWKGLGSFILVCSIGALIGLAVGESLYGLGLVWWLAGFASTIVAAVWNFSLSSTFTWRSS